jgi:CheY-like chemotaxis protein
MPGMTGAEVARRVQPLRPDLPILFMTGYADCDTFFGAVAEEQIVKKPFLPADLAAKVHTMLGPAAGRPSNVLSWRQAVIKG